MQKTVVLLPALIALLSACNGTEQPNEGASLLFHFKFDSTQVRLNNLGQPATIAAGHAAQSPRFNSMSAHYVELAPTALTALGDGEVLYRHAETTAGGTTAIAFDQATIVAEGETFLTVPIADIKPGTYPHLRVSLAYQNYDIKVRGLGISTIGTLASFIGFNTYIQSYTVKNQSITVNGNRQQGYWAFETPFSLTEGQAPAGTTTVPNPLFATSPIPAGSCVVTGTFDQSLQITGNETENILVTVSLSTNNSFEWAENGGATTTFDPLDGDLPTDMGIRGLKGIINF